MPVFKQNLILFLSGFWLGLNLSSILLLPLLNGNCTRSKYPDGNSEADLDVDLASLKRFQESFIFIGVMTTKKNLITRAEAIERTWGKLIPKISGKLTFFIGKGGNYTGHLSVVTLDDVYDEVYPPQKKCFSMIKYMHDNYLDKFEWFMRADDDMFMKPRSLERFLRSVNSSQPQYIGHPGLGTGEEEGDLGLDGHYCLGGPGIVFSRNTLRQTVPEIMTCLRNIVSEHEDTELGRCVYQLSGLSCSQYSEIHKLFYLNVEEEEALFKQNKRSDLMFALTLHPVKQQEHVYALYSYFNTERVLKLGKKMSDLYSEVTRINSRILPKSTASSSDAVNELSAPVSDRRDMDDNVNEDIELLNELNWDASQVGTIDKIKEDNIWEFMRNGSVYSYKIPFNEPFEQVELKGRQLGLAASIGALNEFTSASEKPVFSYVKVSPRFGLEHITGAEENNSTYNLYISLQRFRLTEIAEDSTFVGYVDKTIHVILPLYKRSATFARFIEQLNSSLSGYPGRVVIKVALYADTDDEYLKSATFAGMSASTISSFSTEILLMSWPHTRSNAIKTGLTGLLPDSLILIVDVDMTFTADFLHRVFLNTKLGKQVYYPIPFTQYYKQAPCYTNPENCSANKTDFDFGQDTGTWRYFDYKVVGIYKSDITRIQGVARIRGGVNEDIEFFDKCLNHGLKVLRSVDTSLVRLYHKSCDVSLPRDQFKTCTESREELYASESTLANILFNTSNVE